MGEGGAGAELHVAVQPDLRPAQQGAGGVHHVAFRTPDAEYDGWADRLNKLRVPNSGKVDRFWFRSLYFREPNGILFEIASDGPGFGVDEPMDRLGEKLVLPPFLEPQRAADREGAEGDLISCHSGAERLARYARLRRAMARRPGIHSHRILNGARSAHTRPSGGYGFGSRLRRAPE